MKESNKKTANVKSPAKQLEEAEAPKAAASPVSEEKPAAKTKKTAASKASKEEKTAAAAPKTEKTAAEKGAAEKTAEPAEKTAEKKILALGGIVRRPAAEKLQPPKPSEEQAWKTATHHIERMLKSNAQVPLQLVREPLPPLPITDIRLPKLMPRVSVVPQGAQAPSTPLARSTQAAQAAQAAQSAQAAQGEAWNKAVEKIKHISASKHARTLLRASADMQDAYGQSARERIKNVIGKLKNLGDQATPENKTNTWKKAVKEITTILTRMETLHAEWSTTLLEIERMLALNAHLSNAPMPTPEGKQES